MQRVPETTHLWLVPLSKGSAYPGGRHTQNSETGLDIFTRPRTPPACRPAASAEMPTWHSAPEEMLRAVGRKQKRPVFRGLSSERERSGEMGLKVGDSCRAASQRDSAVVRFCWLERTPPNYECHKADVNGEAKEKSKLEETPCVSPAEQTSLTATNSNSPSQCSKVTVSGEVWSAKALARGLPSAVHSRVHPWHLGRKSAGRGPEPDPGEWRVRCRRRMPGQPMAWGGRGCEQGPFCQRRDPC